MSFPSRITNAVVYRRSEFTLNTGRLILLTEGMRISLASGVLQWTGGPDRYADAAGIANLADLRKGCEADIAGLLSGIAAFPAISAGAAGRVRKCLREWREMAEHPCPNKDDWSAGWCRRNDSCFEMGDGTEVVVGLVALHDADPVVKRLFNNPNLYHYMDPEMLPHHTRHAECVGQGWRAAAGKWHARREQFLGLELPLG